MSTPIIICDDSSLARKQMARSLPEGWDIDVTFAAHGEEAIDALKAGKGEIVFLDLNMPVMDGYQMLEAMQAQNLSSTVIVVSGDIQPEAHSRVMALGAKEFVKKPVAKDKLLEILQQSGIDIKTAANAQALDVKTNVRDGCQEVANVAMGRAADLLARLLNVFVVMPIPNVNMIEMSELRMTLDQVADEGKVSAVCQGFIGSGISGEALLIFNESSETDLAKLMNYDGDFDGTLGLELFMDVASILISACLKGIADQLDITFSQGHPMVLGHHVKVSDLVQRNGNLWTKTLAIEMGYRFENQNINCDLLLLFTEDSMDELNQRVSYISE